MIIDTFQIQDNLLLYRNNDRFIMGTTIRSKSTYSHFDNNYALHTLQPGSREWITTLNNRKKLLDQLGFTSLITLNQIHDKTIHRVDSGNFENFEKNPLIEGDGLYTRKNDILIAVLTADCVPIYYSAMNEEDKPVIIGIAHAGWRGVFKKIHLEMIRTWVEKENVSLSSIRVLIGPHIHGCCYEVSEELYQKFSEQFEGIRIGRKNNQSYFLNLEGIIYQELIQAGIAENQFSSAGLCTYCNKAQNQADLYSYRKGEKSGRMLSFIGMKES